MTIILGKLVLLAIVILIFLGTVSSIEDHHTKSKRKQYAR